MTQFRPQTAAQLAPVAALVADLDAIARIERALDVRARRTPHQARPDFSRLKRFLPDLKI